LTVVARPVNVVHWIRGADMKPIIAGACAALALSTTAVATTAAFDAWVGGLSQNGWRLIAVSEPLKAAMLMGPDTTDATGRRITTVRYEFMGGTGGGYGALVAHDAIDCKAGTIDRLKVTGYQGNNLAGQAAEQTVTGQPFSAAPDSFQQEEAHYACGLATTLKIATASPDPKKKPPADDANKMICRSEAVVGSIVPIRRCETKLQAELRRKEDQDAVAAGQRVERITESSGPVFKGP
jgi:hypothetical protein